MELRGVQRGVSVFDDFAHHPTAILETLRGARWSSPNRRLWAIFEPRSATSCRRVFQDDFARAFVESAAYSDLLRTEEVHGAFIDRQLIGTASWLANSDDGETARIASVFVHPVFTRLGIGGRLLGEVEARAAQSGFDQLGATATINAVPFFERHGYAEASRGVKAFGPACWLPVAFLRKRASRIVRAGSGAPGLGGRCA